MKTFTTDELNKILENHKHWLFEDCDGWESLGAHLRDANLSGANLRCANLCEANLCEANLIGANLRCADLRGANLGGANLRCANLCDANLSGANLRCANLGDANLGDTNLHGANLCYANLGGANLSYANLCDANLCEANLIGADLRGANLGDADLRGANLRGANLGGADLRGANLGGANLDGANLIGAVNIPFIPMTCPDTGEFIGWKKAIAETNLGSYYCIVKLFIPSDAKRSSATSRKCRCDKAVVVDIKVIGYYGKEPITILKCFSQHDEDFTYEIHKTVSVDNFDENRFCECAPGIHFFINKQEAIDY